MHSPFLQFGHLHIPIYGVFVALGLMAALTLSQRTARDAGLSPESVWNTGMMAIISAFVISRLLLIAFNLHSFLQYPLLVLALPSLTGTGVFLSEIFMLGYIRWRRLPLRPLLDALAPCVALIWAALSLGRQFDGTRDGMPTHLPWRVSTPGGNAVHPVELYTFIVASLLCVALLRTLRLSRNPGHAAGVGLIASGLAIFFLDFFRLPSELFDRSPIEGSQIIGIAMILTGTALMPRAADPAQNPSS